MIDSGARIRLEPRNIRRVDDLAGAVDQQHGFQLAHLEGDAAPAVEALPGGGAGPAQLHRAADWSLWGEAVLGSPLTFWSNSGLPPTPIVFVVSAGSVEFACSNPFGSSRIR